MIRILRLLILSFASLSQAYGQICQSNPTQALTKALSNLSLSILPAEHSAGNIIGGGGIVVVPSQADRASTLIDFPKQDPDDTEAPKIGATYDPSEVSFRLGFDLFSTHQEYNFNPIALKAQDRLRVWQKNSPILIDYLLAEIQKIDWYYTPYAYRPISTQKSFKALASDVVKSNHIDKSLVSSSRSLIEKLAKSDPNANVAIGIVYRDDIGAAISLPIWNILSNQARVGLLIREAYRRLNDHLNLSLSEEQITEAVSFIILDQPPTDRTLDTSEMITKIRATRLNASDIELCQIFNDAKLGFTTFCASVARSFYTKDEAESINALKSRWEKLEKICANPKGPDKIAGGSISIEIIELLTDSIIKLPGEALVFNGDKADFVSAPGRDVARDAISKSLEQIVSISVKQAGADYDKIRLARATDNTSGPQGKIQFLPRGYIEDLIAVAADQKPQRFIFDNEIREIKTRINLLEKETKESLKD